MATVADADDLPRTPLCPACGIVALVHATRCASCEAPLGQPRIFAPPLTDEYWVALRCTFMCRACGFPTPLDGVTTSTELDCAQCGSLQRFDPSAWGDGLAFARAVGDLGGPHPEGRYPSGDVWIGDINPYREVGSTKAFATRQDERVSIDACPGFPVCRSCRQPLECQIAGTRVQTRCGGCGMVAQYAIPSASSSFGPDLRGVVSEEHRLERREVRVQTTQSGVAALTCPQCGAALHGIAGPLVECAYCRTLAFIPPRARPRESGRLVAPSVFWVAFAGPSPERVELEAPGRPPAEKPTKAKAVQILGRGLAPLPGIELAPRATGIDVKQWTLVVVLTALALGVGYVVMLAANGL
jgi:hypothetical protein